LQNAAFQADRIFFDPATSRSRLQRIGALGSFAFLPPLKALAATAGYLRKINKFALQAAFFKGLKDSMKERIRKSTTAGVFRARRTKLSAVAVCFCLLAQFAVPCRAFSRVDIKDLSHLSQNPLSYIDDESADKPMLPATLQQQLDGESNSAFFAPWHRQTPHHSKELASWGFRKYKTNPGYDQKGRPRNRDWIAEIERNAHIADYPQQMSPAITLRNTAFRILPTHESHFNYPSSYVLKSFDNMQQSLVGAGTPVLVTLTSRDKKWFLAETNHIIGWIRAEDVAKVTADFITSWENKNYITILKDKTPVTCGGKILYRVPLGAYFPQIGESTDTIRIAVPMRGLDGKATLSKGGIPRNAAAKKPLPFTPRNVARLAAELVGGQYGWGDVHGRRDCSSTMRDLFAPFGILLPRNSSDQAGAGRFVSLLGLSPEKKEKTILKQAVPWRTLLWMPGHIMLYIGAQQGRPLVFHNFWKVGTRGPHGGKRSIVVGRTVITTLYPGRERPDIDPSRANMLLGLTGIILLGEQNQHIFYLP